MNPKRASSKGRVERRKEKTRQQIVTVAVQLFRQYGFDATTMEQIAGEVDIAKGTLYSHFPTKEALISEYVQQSFKEHNPDRILQFRELSDTRSRLTFILNELMGRVQVQKDIFERYLAYRIQHVVSLRPDPNESTKSDFDLLAVEIIKLGQAHGEIRADLPPDMLVDLFEFVFVEVAKQFYRAPEQFDTRAVIEQGVNLFMNGAAVKGE